MITQYRDFGPAQWLGLGLVLLLLAVLGRSAAGHAMHDAAQITIVDPVVFADESSETSIAVRALFPSTSQGTLPVIIFSHGAGLSRDHYSQLTHFWARAGFLVLQPDHGGAAVDGFPPAEPAADDLWRSRIFDLSRVANSLPQLASRVPALANRIDRERVYLAGHSFGAHSVAALVGARVWNAQLGDYESFPSPEIRGALLLAPPGLGDEALRQEWAARGSYLRVDWSSLRGPILVAVGENDAVASMMTTRDASWHADVYQRSEHRPMCLLTLSRVGHYLGGVVDPRRTGAEDSNPQSLALLRRATVSFLEAAEGQQVQRLEDLMQNDSLARLSCRS